MVEIASDKTADVSVTEKPAVYSRMRVPEYFFYAPRPEARERLRLRGWRSAGDEEPEMPTGVGRLWSDILLSYLVPEGGMLRLLSPSGEVRLKKDEVEARARAAAER